MPNVAALSCTVIERDIVAGDRACSDEQSFRWSPQVDAGYQATGVTFLEERKEWLVNALKTLAKFSSLENDWDSYGAQAPSRLSIDNTRTLLRVLAKSDFEPTSVDASAEGGVCVSFQKGDRYGDVECLNSGEVLAVTSVGGDETNVWEIEDLGQDLSTTLSRIRTFFLP